MEDILHDASSINLLHQKNMIAMPLASQETMCNIGEKVCFITLNGVYLRNSYMPFNCKMLEVEAQGNIYRCVSSCSSDGTKNKSLLVIGTSDGSIILHNVPEKTTKIIKLKNDNCVVSVRMEFCGKNVFVLGVSYINQSAKSFLVKMNPDNFDETMAFQPIMELAGKKESDPILLSQTIFMFRDKIYFAFGGTSGHVFLFSCVYDQSEKTVKNFKQIHLKDHKSEVSSLQIFEFDQGGSIIFSRNQNSNVVEAPNTNVRREITTKDSNSLGLLTTGLDGTARLYRIPTDEVRPKVTGHSKSDTIKLSFIGTCKSHTSGVSGSCTYPGGVCTIGLDGFVTYFSIGCCNLEEVRTVPLTNELLNIVSIYDGDLFCLSDVKGFVHAIDRSGHVVPSFTGFGGAVTQIQGTQYGAVASSADGTIRVFSNSLIELLRPIVHGFPVKTFALVKPRSVTQSKECQCDFIVSGSEETVLRALLPSVLDNMIVAESIKGNNVSVNFSSIFVAAIEAADSNSPVCFSPSALELEPRALLKENVLKETSVPRHLNNSELAHFTLYRHEISGGIANCRSLRASPDGKYVIGRTIINPGEPSDVFVFRVCEEVTGNDEDKEAEEYYRRERARNEASYCCEDMAIANEDHNAVCACLKSANTNESQTQTKHQPPQQVRPLAESPFVFLKTTEQISDVDFLSDSKVVTVDIHGDIHIYTLDEASACTVTECVFACAPEILDAGVYFARRLGNNLVVAGGTSLWLLSVDLSTDGVVSLNIISSSNTEISITAIDTNGDYLAVGYLNGKVDMYQCCGGFSLVSKTACGHPSPVSAVSISPELCDQVKGGHKMNLVSGALDGSVGMWSEEMKS